MEPREPQEVDLLGMGNPSFFQAYQEILETYTPENWHGIFHPPLFKGVSWLKLDSFECLELGALAWPLDNWGVAHPPQNCYLPISHLQGSQRLYNVPNVLLHPWSFNMVHLKNGAFQRNRRFRTLESIIFLGEPAVKLWGGFVSQTLWDSNHHLPEKWYFSYVQIETKSKRPSPEHRFLVGFSP